MIPNGYRIRAAVAEDVACLPEIERQAGLLFDDHLELIGLTKEFQAPVNSVENFEKAQRAGRLWVAVPPSGDPVGFALVQEIGGFAHLEELDVLPQHGRKGVGSALLNAVCAWAAQGGYPAVTLSTFRDIPWNAPFYQRRGFRVVPSSELSAGHVQLVASEQSRGLRADLRVMMACSINNQ
ncbi:MAG: GNAT family N-acetyltransferase [Acidobacteriia bacterium]|nr:GNAT family N-acetyltransferase [Terriglobia bacterium]